MALKKLSYKTESIVNIILNNSLKSAWWIEGKPWVKIPQIHLAKILKCTTDCISLHICKLVKEGVLFREQFGAKDPWYLRLILDKEYVIILGMFERGISF